VGTVPVRGCWTTLRRCLVNLLDNATYAAGSDGTVQVTLDRQPDQVRVLVEDDGPGFGRVVPRTGLGLKGTRRALAPLGGSLSVGPSRFQDGACVVLSLPIASAAIATAAAR
jgi:signal transduction histidine kinase